MEEQKKSYNLLLAQTPTNCQPSRPLPSREETAFEILKFSQNGEKIASLTGGGTINCTRLRLMQTVLPGF